MRMKIDKGDTPFCQFFFTLGDTPFCQFSFTLGDTLLLWQCIKQKLNSSYNSYILLLYNEGFKSNYQQSK